MVSHIKSTTVAGTVTTIYAKITYSTLMLIIVYYIPVVEILFVVLIYC